MSVGGAGKWGREVGPGHSSLTNASNKRTFKEEMLRNIQQSACNHVNDLVTDEMEVDEFEDNELGNFSIEALCLAVQGYESNHFFALHGMPGDKWLLKDSLKT
eukprot:13448082-Ditylum_brightwellii.AAC.1